MVRNSLLLHAARAKIIPDRPHNNDPTIAPIVETAETLHETYLEGIFQYVARRVPRREDAEDITAEVFAAALISWPKYCSKVLPYPWLLGVARRKIIDARRRQEGRGFFRRREVLASETSSVAAADGTADTVWDRLTTGLSTPNSEAPEAQALLAERRKTIHDLVESLKEEQREALLLHYVEDLPVRDVALVLERSPAAVNSLLQRARQTLLEKGKTYFLPDFEEGRTR
jgi:RNA polymerase sigma-70 factor (ECF subfamily)